MTDHLIYRYVRHDRTQTKLERAAGPVKVAEQLPSGNPAARFNAWFAVRVTRGVGTMWCAYAFAALALIRLPQAIQSHNAVTLVSWISQTFLQLVLLSVIIVGQNVLAAAADKRSEDTHNDADAVLYEAVKLQEHLHAQDQVLGDLRERLARVEEGSAWPPTARSTCARQPPLPAVAPAAVGLRRRYPRVRSSHHGVRPRRPDLRRTG